MENIKEDMIKVVERAIKDYLKNFGKTDDALEITQQKYTIKSLIYVLTIHKFGDLLINQKTNEYLLGLVDVVIEETISLLEEEE